MWQKKGAPQFVFKDDRPLHQRSPSQLSLSDEWESPRPIYDAWSKILGGFTLDVAASNSNHLCPLYLTKEQNALSVPWGTHRCWMNPPYSRGNLLRWTGKAFFEATQGATVCGLVPAKTDTRWWHEHVWNPNRELTGVPMGINSFVREEPPFEGETLYVRSWSHLTISVHFIRGRLSFLHKGKKYDTSRDPSAVVVWEPGYGYLARG